MLLSCADRINIPSILPLQGDLISMSMSFEIVGLVKLSEVEKDRLAIKQDENGHNIFVSFPSCNDFETEIPFSSSQLIFLKQAAAKVNSENKVTLQNINTIQKLLV